MLAPHAVDIAVTISSLIASLCFTFAEPFDFSLRQVKLCIGQRKYKQKFTTQGLTDRPTDWLTKLLFHILQNSRKKKAIKTKISSSYMYLAWWQTYNPRKGMSKMELNSNFSTSSVYKIAEILHIVVKGGWKNWTKLAVDDPCY